MLHRRAFITAITALITAPLVPRRPPVPLTDWTVEVTFQQDFMSADMWMLDTPGATELGETTRLSF